MLHITTPLPGPVARNCTCAPGFNCEEFGDTVRLDEFGTIVAVAVAVRLGAATGVAITITLGAEGTLAGAVYKPEAEIEPHVGPEHPAPAIVQLTDVFVLPVTVAVNCCVPPTLICAVDGATDAETAVAASIATVAEADFVG
jgi:hypothetical protein